jgi:4-hydroxyphenylpyruvate dioxygenase
MPNPKNSNPNDTVINIHYIEMYVSNLFQAAHFYQTTLGFRPIARAHSTSKHRNERSVVFQKGRLKLVLTAPVQPGGSVSDHLNLHGEGVKNIALTVRDADATFTRAVASGMKPISEPAIEEDEYGSVRTAIVQACGDLVHSLVEVRDYKGPFLPGFEAQEELTQPPTGRGIDTRIVDVDHVALGVPQGELDRITKLYVEAFGFREAHQEAVSTDLTAMDSKVVQNAAATVRFPIMEPAAGKRRSQIEEYLESHHGPGAQHLAFLSEDILSDVRFLRSAGIEFLPIPATYYDRLPARVGDIPLEWDDVRRFGVLVDRDNRGLLLQSFSRPIGSRPTLFLELIERRGATGFGSGNIRALFEAVEREQALRSAAP